MKNFLILVGVVLALSSCAGRGIGSCTDRNGVTYRSDQGGYDRCAGEARGPRDPNSQNGPHFGP